MILGPVLLLSFLCVFKSHANNLLQHQGRSRSQGGGCAGGSYSETKDCCTSDSPCSANQGDCDNDDECAGNLACGRDNCGSSFSWKNADCCFDCVDLTGTWNCPLPNGGIWEEKEFVQCTFTQNGTTCTGSTCDGDSYTVRGYDFTVTSSAPGGESFSGKLNKLETKIRFFPPLFHKCTRE